MPLLSKTERWTCALAVLLAVSPASGHAQDAVPADAGAVELDAVTVTATGADQNAAVSTTTELTRPQIETEVQPDSISEMLSIIPGVTTSTSPDSPATSVNIRGFQDFGRVNVTVDGARQNFGVSGHGSNGSFFLDPEMVQEVDVIRGTGGAIDGTGSIGGGVNFTTIDATSVLDPGDVVGAKLKTRYSTNGPALLEHGEVGGRIGDAFDVIAAGTWNKQPRYTDGHDDIVPLSQDELLSGLVKARFFPSEGEQVTASALRSRDEFDTGINSSTVKATTAEVGTYAVSYKWDDPDNELIDLKSNVYYTTTRTDQTIVKDRNDRDPNHISQVGLKRWFQIDTIGGDASNTAHVETGPVQHDVQVGANVYHDAVKTEGFDADTTPPGDRLVYGAFVQDRMRWGAFELIPGIRYDAFEITAGKDSNTGDRFSPKVTAAINPADPLTIFASYSEGFRPPTVTETFVEAIHPGAADFVFLPNPNLKGEEAHELQGGVSLRFDSLLREGDKLRARFAAYNNIVNDYIELKSVYDPEKYPRGAYQYQNIDEAKLWGSEFEATYDLRSVFFGFNYADMHGIDSQTNERLALIPANRISGTIGGRLMDEKMVLGMRVTHVGPVKNPPPNSPYLPTEAYNLVDLFATAQVTENFTVALNIDNLLNEYYVQYLNVSASPGRNAKFTATLRF